MAGPATAGESNRSLTGHDLVAALRIFARVLEERRERINDMNVFPVADADTGSNLFHTVTIVVEQLDGPASIASLSAAASSVVRAALFAGRGASGLILTQALTGVCERLGEIDEASPAELAAALVAGGRAAYGAVEDPVEGTILTAAARAGSRAVQAADAGGGLLDVAGAARDGAWEAVAESPDLLPVLREAGVVDGGAVGFGLLMDSLFAALDGQVVPFRELPEGSAIDLGLPEERYEVIASIRGADATALRAELSAIGTSVAVASGGPGTHVHCHVAEPAATLSILSLAGTITQVDITDLHRQIARRSGPLVVAVAPTVDLSLDLLDAAPDRVIAPPDVRRLTQLVESGPNGDVVLVVIGPAEAVTLVSGRSGESVDLVTVDTVAEAVAVIKRRH